MDLADRLSGAQCEAAQKEVLALTVSVLTKVFPDRFQLQGTVLSNVATGEVFDVADTCTNPMDTVARLVQVLLSRLLFVDFVVSVSLFLMWNQLFRHVCHHDVHLLIWPHFALSIALHDFALLHKAETYCSVYDLSHPSGCTSPSVGTVNCIHLHCHTLQTLSRCRYQTCLSLTVCGIHHRLFSFVVWDFHQVAGTTVGCVPHDCWLCDS